MKLDFRDERLLAVVAHPDDADLLCAGTLARARDDGAVIGICVLCQGDKGQPSQEIADLAEVRREEMQRASKRLGAALLTAGLLDGTLTDDVESRTTVTELLRQFRPTLVLTHSPGDYHPDHRAASRLAEAASWFSASHGQKTNSPPLDAPPALWWMDTVTMSGFEPAFYIDVTDYLPLKEQMLACHQSQMQRGTDRDFAPLVELMRRQGQARGLEAGVEAAEAFCPARSFKRTRAW